jgi:putative nucleotidyltransferase with HDIG domain
MAGILLLGERSRAAGLRSLLREDGHRVSWLRRTEDWRAHEGERRPDLIVAAVDQPGRVLAAPGNPPPGCPAPLLFVQSDSSFAREPFLEERIVDCISGPFMREELLGRADALIRVRRLIRREPHDDSIRRGPGALRPRGEREGLGRRLGTLLGSTLARRERPLTPYLEVAARVARWTDRQDAFKPGHAERVSSFCGVMAEGLRLGEAETASLLRAAMLHDIGKVALPIEILRQRGPLGEDQRRLMHTHPHRGATLLRALDPDEDVVRAVLYHHERPDGAGYYGKQGDAIPLGARIVAVAEVFDAMTQSRVGQPLTRELALDRLRRGRGTALDRECVDALVGTLQPRVRAIPLAPLRPLPRG